MGETALTTAGDISWSTADGTFNLRVAAIVGSRNEVLLCSVEVLGYWFLPGGRNRLGESSTAALARELTEELGHEFPAGKLALVVENIYTGPRLQHEVGLYYRFAWPDSLARDDLNRGIEPGHRFCWAPLRELGSMRFEPAALVPFLQDPQDGLRHVILDRREAASAGDGR
jgi:ADP-ribose pyrophosphatase YjhB (NUDIX family)